MHSKPDRSLIIRFLASGAVLAAFLLTTSCDTAGSGTAAPPSPLPPSCIPSGTATARFTDMPGDGGVNFSETISGIVKVIPSGQDVWLVVWPALAPAYWPQRGALAPDMTGRFIGTAGFGSSQFTDMGEKFNLMLVEGTYSEIVWLRAAWTASTRANANRTTGLPNSYRGGMSRRQPAVRGIQQRTAAMGYVTTAV